MTANVSAWETWIHHAESIIQINVHMAGAMFTLNLDFLRFLFENNDFGDRMIFYRKIKTIFDIWKRLQDKKDNPKTQEAMKRTKELQRAR